jgi:ABC-2 type transport system ATP-binding protein
MTSAIVTSNLGRNFGEICAVDRVSFEVKTGEVLGFLGPNGAGKSTTMKMLTGFLTPSFGTALVGGYDVVDNPREVRASLGYLPENAPLYGEMSVVDFLSFIAEVRALDSAERKNAIGRVVEMTSLGSVLNQRIETLSKGFRRRVGLAQALIHDPKILILDEPTDGLDPNQKHDVRKLIRAMAREKCIVLSTHILEEVDEVCSRAIIISKGRIVADDSPDNLRSRSNSCGAVTVRFQSSVSREVGKEIAKLPEAARVESRDLRGGDFSITAFPNRSAKLLPSVVRLVEAKSWDYVDLRLESGQIDEVFREITE